MKIPFTLPGNRALLVAAMLALPALASAQTTTPVARALSHLAAQRTRLGLSEIDVADPVIINSYTDQPSGVTHVYLRQRYQGIDVYGAVASLHLDRANKVVSLNSSFLTNVATAARSTTTTPALTPAQAVAAAASALGLKAPAGLQLRKDGPPAAGLVLSEGGISRQEIPVKLVYQPMPGGELILAWDVTIDDQASDHYWDVRVNAANGQLLDKNDFNISEPVSFANMTQRALATATWPDPAPGARPAASNSYNVYPITVESPLYGSRQVLVNPADATFSPFGWHDTDGAAGPEYTITRGNNVHAYEDRATKNGNPAGYSPDGGANLIFDFAFDQSLTPQAAQDVAITNLFYWNNLMHDVMAYKGFTESAANFQVKNYTGKGLGNDDVRAEAQDGGGTNNANFATPAEGSRPRMQMYLWPGTMTTITAPASLAGSISAGTAAYGPSLTKTGPLTGNVVVANDGTANPARGCNPYLNAAAVAGNFALVARSGKCATTDRIKAAQAAGARLVIIADSIPNVGPVSYSGSTDTVGIRIPTITITKTDSDRIRAVLATVGTTVTLSVAGISRDGDLDNGVIAHEYGHGITNRLTGGGPANCLGNAEQMGEGWSDFFGLWMTTKAGDIGATPRGIGNYLNSEPTTGYGIRSKRYSTDFTVNNLTYAQLGTPGYSEIHAFGEIWCSTLWDLNWAMIDKYGYNTNLKAATGGNNIALQLVLDGCKLQTCSPGFLDGRNGILKADSLYNKGANTTTIWRVFAHRGMGYSAKQGLSTSITDQTAAFDMPPPAVLATRQSLNESALEVYPNPASNQLTVRTQANSSTPVQVTLLTVLGKAVQTTTVPAAIMQQQGAKLNTTSLAAGLYLVKLRTSEGVVTRKVLIQH